MTGLSSSGVWVNILLLLEDVVDKWFIGKEKFVFNGVVSECLL